MKNGKECYKITKAKNTKLKQNETTEKIIKRKEKNKR